MLSTRAFLISGEEEALTQRALAHEDVLRSVQALNDRLNQGPLSSVPAFARLQSLHASYDQVAEHMIALRQAGQTTEALDLFDVQSNPLVLSVQDASNELQNQLQGELLQANRTYSNHTGWIIFTIALTFLAGTSITGLLLLRNFLSPLREFENFEEALMDAAQTGVYKPVHEEVNAAQPLVEAYNALTMRLAESSETQTRYMQRLSHDMNSLLASIMGYAALVAEPSVELSDEEMERYGQVIVRQTERIQALMEDAMLGAQIATSQFRPVLGPTRLDPLLKAICKELSQKTGREIRYENHLEAAVVLADALSLRNAVWKVLENAVKFSPGGQPVSLTMQPGSDGRAVEIVIADQGMGIAAGDLPALFKPFSRIKNEATAGIPGNGMGLYIARAIARAHHGQLELASTPGQGTTATIRLPLETGVHGKKE